MDKDYVYLTYVWSVSAKTVIFFYKVKKTPDHLLPVWIKIPISDGFVTWLHF